MAWLKDRLRRCEPAPAVGDRRLAPCPAGQPPGAGEQQPDPSMAPDILYGCRRPPGCPPALPGRVADAHACHAAHAHALCDGVGSGEGCPCHAALAMPLLFLCLPWLTLHGALLLLPSVPSAQRPACPQPSAPAPAPWVQPPPALPLARLSSVLSALDPNTDTGEVPLTPLILICTVGTRLSEHSRPNFGRSQREFERRGKIINCG